MIRPLIVTLPAGLAFALLAACPLGAAEAPVMDTLLVQSTAVPGVVVELDKIPGNVQSLGVEDLTRNGVASLTQAMNSRLGSINSNDNLDDPFQPDILFHGFEASPVLGTPQGLAVYQNGVRVNEAFGDVVNWDLIPDIAINRVDIASANPVYGLNALGGAISVSMKNGFTYQGASAQLSGGAFQRRSAAFEFGASTGQLGLYAAANALHQDGWRAFSSDALRQFYGALSARSDLGTLELSYSKADNHLYGQGAAPVQELAVSRSLSFTGPQANLNRLDFLTLNAELKPTDSASLQALAYYRKYDQSIANGNATNYTACTSAQNAGVLCQADGLTPLTSSAGLPLPDISQGGALPIGENDTESIHASGRGAALQLADSHALLGLGNHFAAGATIDYAALQFGSMTRIGLIDPRLVVLPSTLLVDTPEGTGFSATPVLLAAVDQYYGLYVTDTVEVTPRLSLSASGRYNVANIDLHDARGTALNGQNRFTHLNPAIGGTFKLLASMTAYAQISQNNRTPTASEIECSDPRLPCLLPSNLAGDPPNLRQVIAHTGELGLRGRLNVAATEGTVAWNVEVYRSTLDDDIYGVATSASSGFYRNIGATRRQGLDAQFNYKSAKWSAYASYSLVDATFESSLTLPSPSNPHQDANGNILVNPGARLPGVPRQRFKAGLDVELLPRWSLGASLTLVSDSYYHGDEANLNPPMPGYLVVGVHSAYRVSQRMEVFATVENLLDSRYSTYGIYSDPTGVGAPGIPPGSASNGPGVDNRFQSPAAPFTAYAGARLRF